jgi:hypothetical protein
MHYHADAIQVDHSATTIWLIWFGELCRKLDSLPSSEWTGNARMARWTLRHLGHNSHRYRCRLVLEQHRFLRGFSSRSCGFTEVREINRNCCPISFVPLAFETFGPINQAGCNFLSSLGHRLSLVLDDPRGSSLLFQCLSITIQRFNSVCAAHSGTCQHNFLTSRDTPRIYFLFINLSAFGKELPKAI